MRFDHRVGVLVGKAVAVAPCSDLLFPDGQVRALALAFRQLLQDRVQRRGAIADDGHVDANDLVDRGGVDVDVDLL